MIVSTRCGSERAGAGGCSGGAQRARARTRRAGRSGPSTGPAGTDGTAGGGGSGRAGRRGTICPGNHLETIVFLRISACRDFPLLCLQSYFHGLTRTFASLSRGRGRRIPLCGHDVSHAPQPPAASRTLPFGQDLALPRRRQLLLRHRLRLRVVRALRRRRRRGFGRRRRIRGRRRRRRGLRRRLRLRRSGRLGALRLVRRRVDVSHGERRVGVRLCALAASTASPPRRRAASCRRAVPFGA